MDIYQEENCCGLAVLGDFPWDLEIKNDTTEIKEEIIEKIVEYELENYDSPYEPFVKTNMFIATTNENQTKTEEALKELGFIGVEFDSRQYKPNNKLLTLWRKRGYPKGVWKELKKRLKEIENSTEKDLW